LQRTLTITKLTIPFKEHWEQGHTATEYSGQAALEGALARPSTTPPMKEHLFSATDQHRAVNGSLGTHTYRHEVPRVRNEDPVHPKQSRFRELQTTEGTPRQGVYRRQRRTRRQRGEGWRHQPEASSTLRCRSRCIMHVGRIRHHHPHRDL
jgi:hypothetical protein